MIWHSYSYTWPGFCRKSLMCEVHRCIHLQSHHISPKPNVGCHLVIRSLSVLRSSCRSHSSPFRITAAWISSSSAWLYRVTGHIKDAWKGIAISWIHFPYLLNDCRYQQDYHMPTDKGLTMQSEVIRGSNCNNYLSFSPLK